MAMTYDDVAAGLGLTASSDQQPDSYDAIFGRVTPRASQAQARAEPVTDFSGTLKFGSLDTGIDLPHWINKGLAQLGSGMADWTTRIDQLFGKANEQTVDEKRRFDAQLRDGFVGKTLGVVGQAMPALAIPAVGGAPILSGIGTGALTGFMQPVASGESATANTALGAALGGAIPAVGSGIKALVQPNAATSATASLAGQYGIPLGAGDLTKNGLMRGARSMTNDMPIAGIPGARLRDAQQAALNTAVGETFGAAAPRLTPQIMDAAKTRMGAEFDRIWGGNTLTVDAPMFGKMQQLLGAVQDLPKTQGARLQNEINDFMSKMVPNAQGAPTVAGNAANNFQQWLRRQADSSQGFLRDAFSELRAEMIGAFNRSVSAADAAALTLNRTQYKAFKTVEPLLSKGAAGVAGRELGDVPAALLPSAVNQSYRGLASQTSAPPLADIAQVAGRFMVDRTPQTGGSARALLQGSMLGDALGLGLLPVGAAVNSTSIARALGGQSVPRGLIGPSSLSDAAKETMLLGAQRWPLLLPGLLSQSPAFEQ